MWSGGCVCGDLSLYFVTSNCNFPSVFVSRAVDRDADMENGQHGDGSIEEG